MFDVGASELLLIVIVAIVVIGPKDMPLALRTAGRWIGKIRRISGHFRTGIETMIREAEMEEAERKWREHNERIMAAHPASELDTQMEPLPPADASQGQAAAQGEPPVPVAPPAASAEARIRQAAQPPAAGNATPSEDEPLLPLHGLRPPP